LSTYYLQASKTVSHDISPLLGLNHYDSLGYLGENPGFKSFEYEGVNESYFEITPKDQSETEPFLYIMASGATVGITLTEGLTTDQFFLERSAIKLALGTHG
jgi:hypothetical protein